MRPKCRFCIHFKPGDLTVTDRFLDETRSYDGICVWDCPSRGIKLVCNDSLCDDFDPPEYVRDEIEKEDR